MLGALGSLLSDQGRRIALLVGLFLASSAQAQTARAVVVEPVDSSVGTPLSARVPGLNPACVNVSNSTISREGQTVTLTLTYTPLPCGVPPPSQGVVVPLGSFEAGQYTLIYRGIDSTQGPAATASTGFSVRIPYPVSVDPNPARAGALVTAQVRGMTCGVVKNSSVAREGSLVTLTVDYLGLACVTMNPIVRTFPLGAFEPGQYTLTLRVNGISFAGDATVSTPFAVGDASIPSTTAYGLVALVLALSAGAWLGLGTRRTG